MRTAIRPEVLARTDGFAARRVEPTDGAGFIEVAVLAPTLATDASEMAIRETVARLTAANRHGLAAVLGIDRDDVELRILTRGVPGVPLSTVLSALASGQLTLETERLLDVAAAVVRAVAAAHAGTGTAHGALVPAHVILTTPGDAVLSGGVFGAALETMQWNRDRHWREFGLALPAAASWPRFDHRADVVQLGVLVLTLLLRRPLALEEYPRGLADLVSTACAPLPHGSGLRAWLQKALELHPRAAFASAVDAAAEFGPVAAAVSGRPWSAASVQTLVRTLTGDVPRPRRTVAAAPTAAVPAAAVRPVVAEPLAEPALPVLRPLELLRAVFPKLRAS